MRHRAIAIAAVLGLVLAGSSTIAAAQAGGYGGHGGRGGFGRGASALARAPGVEVPEVVNAVNLLIEHRQEVTLSDTQFTKVIAIKRSLDSTNAPLMRKLDSVQRLFKKGPMFGDGSAERRDSLAEARSLVRDVTAAVRENNAAGRDRAYALLSSRQIETAHSLEAAAEQKIADDAQKGGGGRGGKPPSS